MQEYQQRVVDEKGELDLKRQKLNEFLETPIFENLEAEEKGRLRSQASIMEEYSDVLGQRIAAFK